MGHYSLTASGLLQCGAYTLFVTGNCNGSIFFSEISNPGDGQDYVTAIDVGKINLTSVFSKQVHRKFNYTGNINTQHAKSVYIHNPNFYESVF